MHWFKEVFTKSSTETASSSSNTNGFELKENEITEQYDKNISAEISNSSKNENKETTFLAVQENGFKLQLVHKLNEIDSLYRQGVTEYKESIQRYNIEIEKFKYKIDEAREVCIEKEKKLLEVENRVAFESKTYEKLQAKALEKISSIVELQDEYRVVLDEEDYKKSLQRKENELLDCLDDIESVELILLNIELENLNLLELLEPKRRDLTELTLLLKEIEMEKAHFESMGLHKVANVQLENKNFWNEGSTEIVDTIEIESSN